VVEKGKGTEGSRRRRGKQGKGTRETGTGWMDVWKGCVGISKRVGMRQV
jgi:hypothetical protein